MKKITLALFCMLSVIAYGQVNINENFDAGPNSWTGDNSTSVPCAVASQRINVYSGNATDEIASPNQVGASNATDLDISFDYKIVDYDGFADPTNPTAPGWGTAELQYSTDAGVNWTTVLTIDDGNHVTSSDCVTMMATIDAASLPNGSDVQLQILTTWVAGDWYFYVDNFVAQQDLGCTAAIIDTVTAVNDCGNDQFTVEVVVTTVNDATQFNDGSSTTAISAGTNVLGPYPKGTPITLTVEHSISACDFSLASVVDTCPPDTDATLTIGSASCGVTQTTTIAYDPGVADVNWVELVYDGSCDEVTVDTETSVLADTEIGLFDSAGDLIGSDDDGGTGALSLFNAGTLAAGTYYIAVGGFNVDYADGFSATSSETEVGDIVVNAIASEVLSIDDEEINSFTYFPNPVKNTLNLNAQNTIDNVTMYNMLGQEVLSANPNSVDSDIDMSSLANGSYFVKVTIANVTKTIRVIKQ